MKPSQSKFIAIVCVVALTLSGCRTLSKVETNTTNAKEYAIKEIHDTLREQVHDSIFHTIYAKGDTVYSTKYVERVKWREKAVVRVDTMWRDSLVTQYKEKRIENKIIPRWCYASLCVWAILFLIVVFKIKDIWQKMF